MAGPEEKGWRSLQVRLCLKPRRQAVQPAEIGGGEERTTVHFGISDVWDFFHE